MRDKVLLSTLVFLSVLTIVFVRPSYGASNPSAFTLKDYLCLYTPYECHGKLTERIYLSPPETIYERKVNGRTFRIPMGYVTTTEFIVDSRYKKEDSSLYLEALMPLLDPHTPQNLREFFTPYERSKISIQLDWPKPGAMSWKESVEWIIKSHHRSYNSPIRRPDKFGLQVWGEDFTKWPRRIPCSSLSQQESPCGTPSTPKDVLIPIELNGPPSVMSCDTEVLEDVDAKIVALSASEQEAYFASKDWVGKRRAVCRHEMYYAPVDGWVRLNYPRRFLPYWMETENRVRSLLDSFMVHAASHKTK